MSEGAAQGPGGPAAPGAGPAAAAGVAGDRGAAAIAGALDAGADGRPLPRWRDRAVLSLLALTVLLQLVAWSQLEGYQLADSVEYMERAQSLARGEAQDAERAVRSFGFSVLLAPFFLVADAFGVEDGRLVVGAVRAFQMLLGLALVVACARIGARLAGRGAGLAAGALVAFNPIFLQYSVSPVSGVASALFVALALERLMLPATRRRAFVGGLALGGAFLMAYQTLLVSGPLVLALLLRDRKAWRGAPLMAVAGLSFGVLAQIALDRVTWGTWGASVGNYVVQNANSTITTFLLRIGEEDAARAVYERGLALMDLEYEVDDPEAQQPRQLQSRAFYLTEIQRMLVLPVLAVLLLGLARAFARPSWRAWILILVLVVNVGVMSLKGAKSFRLWLPLLPMLAPLSAYGLAWLAGAGRARAVRAAAAVALVALAAVLGLRRLGEVNLAQHGVYWDAVELVNERVREEAPGAPQVLVSAYHWAVFERERGPLELVKLPWHLTDWRKLDEARRAACLAVLAGADWFLVHGPVLDAGRDLFDVVNARFEVVDVLWTPATDPTLGPVLVLRARTSERPLLLAETLPPEDPAAYRARLGLDRALLAPMDFLGRGAGSADFDQRVTLLGFELARLASGTLWITYHWTAPAPLAGDYTILDRITSPDGRHAWQNNHRAARGFRPTSEWQPGAILVEGYPLLAGAEPFTDRFQPLGGPYRRADLIPAELWMTLVHQGEDGGYVASLKPAVWGAPHPLDMRAAEVLPGERRRSPEGFVESPDKLVRLARFLVPVHPLFGWPADGRPDPP